MPVFLSPTSFGVPPDADGRLDGWLMVDERVNDDDDNNNVISRLLTRQVQVIHGSSVMPGILTSSPSFSHGAADPGR